MSEFSRQKRNETLSNTKGVIDKVGTFKVLSKRLGVILADAEVHEIALKENVDSEIVKLRTELVTLTTEISALRNELNEHNSIQAEKNSKFEKGFSDFKEFEATQRNKNSDFEFRITDLETKVTGKNKTLENTGDNA